MQMIREWVEQIARNVFWRDIQAVRFTSQWESHPSVAVVLDEGATLPVRAHDTDAGADICCREGFVVPAHNSVEIDTGVHVQLPRGMGGVLKSKSGLNVNHCITTGGLIDEGYTGKVRVRVYNNGDYDYEFAAGDKVTQLVVVPVIYPTYVEVGEITGGERGDAGFGSTGR
jgi:dUTP pyrophosphatase